MSDLSQALLDIGVDKLDAVDTNSLEWQAFCQTNEALFQRVKLAKPEKSTAHILLGLLTKSHIETLSTVEDQRESVQTMNQAIEQNVGSLHDSRFRYQEGQQLLMVTHLWLYLQGYLAMDFSLANDHAEMTANALIASQGGDKHALRCDLMASFYQGKTHSAANLGTGPRTHPLVQWLQSLFK